MQTIIKTKEQHDAALLIIELLMKLDPKKETSEGRVLMYLATEVEAYETNLFGK